MASVGDVLYIRNTTKTCVKPANEKLSITRTGYLYEHVYVLWHAGNNSGINIFLSSFLIKIQF
jgi:hypothetical protein